MLVCLKHIFIPYLWSNSILVLSDYRQYSSAPYFRGICKDCASKYRGRLPQELPYAPKNIDQHYLKSTDPTIALNELTNAEDTTRPTLEQCCIFDGCNFDPKTGDGLIIMHNRQENTHFIRNSTLLRVSATTERAILHEKSPIPARCFVCNKSATSACSRCHKIHYCSIDCQRKDWKEHKTLCKH